MATSRSQWMEHVKAKVDEGDEKKAWEIYEVYSQFDDDEEDDGQSGTVNIAPGSVVNGVVTGVNRGHIEVNYTSVRSSRRG